MVIMPNLVAISLWSKFDVSLNFAKNAKTLYRKTPSRNVSGRFKIDRRETCQGFFFNKSLHFLLTLELTSDWLDNDIPIKIEMYTIEGFSSSFSFILITDSDNLKAISLKEKKQQPFFRYFFALQRIISFLLNFVTPVNTDLCIWNFVNI